MIGEKLMIWFLLFYLRFVRMKYRQKTKLIKKIEEYNQVVKLVLNVRAER